MSRVLLWFCALHLLHLHHLVSPLPSLLRHEPVSMSKWDRKTMYFQIKQGEEKQSISNKQKKSTEQVVKVFRKDSETQRAAELSDEAKTRWKASCCLMIRMLCCRWFSCIDEFEEQSGPSHTKKKPERQRRGSVIFAISTIRWEMLPQRSLASAERKICFCCYLATSFYLCFISRFIFLSLSVSFINKKKIR